MAAGGQNVWQLAQSAVWLLQRTAGEAQRKAEVHQLSVAAVVQHDVLHLEVAVHHGAVAVQVLRVKVVAAAAEAPQEWVRLGGQQ